MAQMTTISQAELNSLITKINANQAAITQLHTDFSNFRTAILEKIQGSGGFIPVNTNPLFVTSSGILELLENYDSRLSGLESTPASSVSAKSPTDVAATTLTTPSLTTQNAITLSTQNVVTTGTVDTTNTDTAQANVGNLLNQLRGL